MTTRMKLTVAYLGTTFAGWQRQAGARTVQGELETAVARATGGIEVNVVGAGRTDAGVHARGQVAHLDLPVQIPPESLVRALNGVLPEAITVRRAAVATSGFHARYSARGKRYTYRAHWGGPLLPWQGLRYARLRPPADREDLEAAVRLLPGYRDWASFTVTDPDQGPTERTVHRAELRWGRDCLTLQFVGGGFLRYQVRRMVGAVLEVAWGRRTLSDLRRMLEDPEPGRAVFTAPARGLTLEQVLYGEAPVLDSLPQG